MPIYKVMKSQFVTLGFVLTLLPLSHALADGPIVDSVLAGHEQILACDAGTPEVNLESQTIYPGSEIKGAFYGIRRDNQDGLGTCFANTAKNFLIGISDGQDNASFLDVALQYKKTEAGSGDPVDLEGGYPCKALAAIKASGYCAQKFSPMEGGESSEVVNGLIANSPEVDSEENAIAKQAIIFGALKKLVSSTGTKSAFLTYDPQKLNDIYQEMKNNPSVKLPLPTVHTMVIKEGSLEMDYLDSVGSNMSIAQSKIFTEDYNNAYASFYPKYVSAIADGKTASDLWKMYVNDPNIQSFLKMHRILPDRRHRTIEQIFARDRMNYLNNVGAEFNRPTYKTELNASLKFLKKLGNYSEDDKNKPFSEFCETKLKDVFPMMDQFQNLIDVLKSSHTNPDLLVDANGKLKSAAELLQLATVPACLNSANRKPFSNPNYTCTDGPEPLNHARSFPGSLEEKHKELRKTILGGLLRGLPLAREFTTSRGNHVHTIVGLRFNKVDRRCEYLIRESQDGISHWTPEAEIFDNAYSLVQIRKGQ
jgi:hypothetical protein